MLNRFAIVSKGGAVLFCVGKCQGDPFKEVINDVLVQENSSKTIYSNDQYTIEWRIINEYELILLAAYSKTLSQMIKFVPNFFSQMSQELSNYKSILSARPHNPTLIPQSEFGCLYERVLSSKECAPIIERKNEIPLLNSMVHSPSPSNPPPRDETPVRKNPNLKKNSKSQKDTAPPLSLPPKVRSWENSSDRKINKNNDKYKYDDDETNAIDVNELKFDSSSEEDQQNVQSTVEKTTSEFFKFFEKLKNKELKISDLEPALENVKNNLIRKNVASSIATSICDSISRSLEGKSLSTFQSVSNLVKGSMIETLTRTLTPNRPVDILQLIEQAKSQMRPLSIVFVGVNGVGKSTTLAKVCAWLLKQGYKVQIAACDTFRSGAVEQLRKHAKDLGNVPLYDQGYNKDPSDIAKKAIERAIQEKCDVLLIDTAGRMQANAPLMQALANLVRSNNPDLILFVGEALVGNDSIDQLTKFNDSLKKMVDPKRPREIDGIILTKFDAVENKVGAAVSMAYITGKPIVFIGNGQTYSDLRTLNVKKIVDMITS